MIPLPLHHSLSRQRRKFRMLRIESKDNKRIKRLRGLAKKKVRMKENLFLIEGLKIVSEALDSGYPLDTVVFSDGFNPDNELTEKLESGDFDVISVTESVFGSISTSVTPQGILAAALAKASTLNEIIDTGRPILILDGISDPGNMGTIVRTADAFQFGGVLVTDDCVDIYNTKSVQASMGSVLRVKTLELETGMIDLLKESGYTITGMDLNGRALSDGYVLPEKCVLVIGSESHGLSTRSKALCDDLVKIPMRGNAESLNAAVAAGIAMFLAGGCGRI